MNLEEEIGQYVTVEERDGALEVMIEALTGKEQEGWAWRVAEQNSIEIIQNFAVKFIWGFWVGYRVSNNQLDGSIVGQAMLEDYLISIALKFRLSIQVGVSCRVEIGVFD